VSPTPPPRNDDQTPLPLPPVPGKEPWADEEFPDDEFEDVPPTEETPCPPPID